MAVWVPVSQGKHGAVDRDGHQQLVGRCAVGGRVEVDVEWLRIRAGDRIRHVKRAATVVEGTKESIATCAATTLTVNDSEAEAPAELVMVRSVPLLLS